MAVSPESKRSVAVPILLVGLLASLVGGLSYFRVSAKTPSHSVPKSAEVGMASKPPAPIKSPSRPFLKGTAINHPSPESTEPQLSVNSLDNGPYPTKDLSTFRLETELGLLQAQGVLRLTPGEKHAVVHAYTTFLLVKAELESRLITGSLIEPGIAKLDIPPYGKSGEDIRQQLRQVLAEAIGGERLAILEKGLRHSLETDFAYFGESKQEFIVTADPEGGYKISHIVRHPSQNAKSRITGEGVYDHFNSSTGNLIIDENLRFGARGALYEPLRQLFPPKN